ncbi:MAG TPA: TetR/AcrR family transcriptional regulator [Acidimicrobiia bacterium]|jgi:AcrR family transcriptional regulator
MADPEPKSSAAPDPTEPAWRQRAVSRSLDAARSRAEKRAKRFLDAAFELMDENGSTEFTIQEVIDRSQQSLRGFYQYFDGKDELLLALFEETVRECIDDVRAVVEGETDPIVRLHAFVIRLHEWCEPPDKPRKRGRHNRRPVSEFMVQLAVGHPDRVKAAMEPVSRLLLDLVRDAQHAGTIDVDDPYRAAALVQQTVMYSWFGNRLIQSPRQRLGAEETWAFCLRGLGG